MRLVIIHPKGGVGRTTTALYLGIEFALRGKRVVLEDRDPARHLTRVFEPVPGLVLEGNGEPRDITIIDTAPEGDAQRAMTWLRSADWALVPVKGPEPFSMQALPLLFEWIREARGARLLGFVPTMYQARSRTCRQWLTELERAARFWEAKVFPPVPLLESIRSGRQRGHPYGPVAEGVLRATAK